MSPLIKQHMMERIKDGKLKNVFPSRDCITYDQPLKFWHQAALQIL